jgi:hypothetical protein
MENYEVKNVAQANEIKAAYDYAVVHNIKFYRAISKTNAIYGWDATPVVGKPNGQHIKALAGQEWFENPHYVEPVVDEKVDEVVDDIVKQVDEVVDEKVDYEALYNQKCKEYDKLREDYDLLEADFDKYQEAVENYKSAIEALKSL